MGKILFKSILSTSTSTQPKKSLKYKSKYVFFKYKILLPKKYLKYKYQNTCRGWGEEAKSNCIDIYGNIVMTTFGLIVNFFSINN